MINVHMPNMVSIYQFDFYYSIFPSTMSDILPCRPLDFSSSTFSII